MTFLSRGFKNLQWYSMTDKAPETPVFRELCHARKQVLAFGFNEDTKDIKHNFRQLDALPYAKEGTLQQKLDELFS